MYLTKHQTPSGPRWAADGKFLPAGVTLDFLLTLSKKGLENFLKEVPAEETATGVLLSPVEAHQEVWGSGVTYMRSREARKAESDTGDIYEKVYDADRPELFFKSAGWRSKGHGQPVRIRKDTTWNVPEPEVTLVINAWGEIVGYSVGDDMSSRDIEGQNPLYLPQAKTYNGSCAVGPGIQLASAEDLTNLPIQLEIKRKGQTVVQGETSTNQMKRSFPELAEYLFRELDFPQGVLLMTGTGIVPPDDFTLAVGDVVRITIGELVLENKVDS